MSNNWEIHFNEIELQYQKNHQFSVDIDEKRPKYYVLEMFPYPSGNIHMGHVRNYTIGDIIARYKMARGYNVLHPMGWDSFGLPAENAAIQHNLHPGDWTRNNINNMRTQLKRLGLSYDWSRELSTSDKSYYQHEQKFFIDFFARGLAYRKESFINWDPVDNTVLANEQVIEGRGWRSGAVVERRKLIQWFLKVSDFRSKLLDALPLLSDNWPKNVISMQDKWIGRSEGAIVQFELSGTIKGALEVFTTRPETLFGTTFCAISIDHPIVHQISDNIKIKAFLEQCNKMGTAQAEIDKVEKFGIDTGLVAVHPLDNSIRVPVYIANFVLMEYGTGAVFGCPGHDTRDNDFASKYDIPIIEVIADDLMCNSKVLDGLSIIEAKKKAICLLEERGKGKKKVTYKLRDWGISRQRYWGCPIPIIHCSKCGSIAVPEDQLPVTLPVDIDLSVTGNPLDHHPTWKYVQCHKCGGDAIRDTDTFDTFFESSWYFIAFCNKGENKLDRKGIDHFLPVNCYIGGVEHAILHLLYARFFTMALKKCDYVGIEEPFKSLITQGMVCHKTYKDVNSQWIFPKDAMAMKSRGEFVAEGKMEKMSKSKKNVVDPSGMIDQYGADAVRMFIVSDSPPEKDLEWSDSGLENTWKFLRKLSSILSSENTVIDKLIKKSFYRAIKELSEDLENFHLNCAIAKIHAISNIMLQYGHDEEMTCMLLRVMEPFVPHFADYMWGLLGNQGTLYDYPWPTVTTNQIIEEGVNIAIQENGKLRGSINVSKKISKEILEEKAWVFIKDRMVDKKIKKIIVVPGKVVNFVV